MSKNTRKNFEDASDCSDLLAAVRFALLDLNWAVEVGESRHLIIVEPRVTEWVEQILISVEKCKLEDIKKETNKLPIRKQWWYIRQILSTKSLVILLKTLEEFQDAARKN